MKVYYRISDASQGGVIKNKPPYVNNENCLVNFITNFLYKDTTDLYIIADNVSKETQQMIEKYVPKENISYVSIGHGAGTFKLCMEEVKNTSNTNNLDEIIYFVENDYVHMEFSRKILEEGIKLGANYVTLYDHPDKYIEPSQGGNPYVEGGGEVTKVFLGEYSHWKLTNSTTMTFAAKRSTLLEDYNIVSKYISGNYPNDFHMFIDLMQKGRTLISPIPGRSTHGENDWLSPLKLWNIVMNDSLIKYKSSIYNKFTK